MTTRPRGTVRIGRAALRGEHPKYILLADRLAELIRGGTFPPGARIPSVRRLAKDLGVAATTAVKAYDLLEAEGLVEARPQSGYYVLPRGEPVPTPMRAARTPSGAKRVSVGDLVLRVMETAGDQELLPFGVASPHPDLIPSGLINRAMARAARREPVLAHAYQFPPGLRRLRVQLARWMLRAGVACGPDDLIVTDGGLEAIGVALRCVTKPGDVVVVQSPAFFGLLQQLESLRLRAAQVPDDPRTGPAPEAILDAVRKHAAACVLLMPTCSNPMGSTMPPDAKQRLVRELARARVPLIEDDAWGFLPRFGSRAPACKAFDRDGLVLYASSVSKWLSPGLRIGWLEPGRFGRRALVEKVGTNFASGSVTQLAAAEVLAGAGLERRLRGMRAVFAETTDRAAGAVTRWFPPGTEISSPLGGYCLWVRMPPGVEAIALFKGAIARGIGCAPGPLFSPGGGQFEECLRLSCGMPWTREVEDGLRELGRLATALAERAGQGGRGGGKKKGPRRGPVKVGREGFEPPKA